MKNEEFSMAGAGRGLKAEGRRQNEEFRPSAGFFILHSAFCLRLASFRLGLALVASCFILHSAFAAKEITTFSQFDQLSREQAGERLPIRFRGVVLCHDLEWGQLFVHDGDHARYFDPRQFSTQPEVGQRVEITGHTMAGADSLAATNLSLAVLGAGTLPAAKSLTFPQLTNELGQWVETRGRIRMVGLDSGRAWFSLHDGGTSIRVQVLGPPASVELAKLRGALVQVRGINDSKISGGRELALLSPGWEHLSVIEAAGIHANPPVMSIESLLNRELGAWTNHAVRLSGHVVSRDTGKSLVIRDPTGLLRAQVSQPTGTQPEDRVEVIGYLNVTPTGPVLVDAWFELLKPRPLGVSLPVTTVTNRVRLAELTQISRVLKLRPEEVVQGVPVRLRGVVVYAHPEWSNGYLHDRSGSIYFTLTDPGVRAGDLIELTGEASAGGYAPMVINTQLRALGTTNLPAPTKADLTDIGDGHLDAQWIEMEGVVRGMRMEEGRLHLRLMSPKGQFNALLPTLGNQPVPNHLVDALVRIQGICGSILNVRRQLVNIELQVPTLDQIKILEVAPADPFSLDPTLVGEVATFDPDRLAGRRIKVSGVVTLTTDQGYFVQDDSGGIRVRSTELNRLKPSERVEVLGFTVLGAFSPELEEASFRPAGQGSLPAAQPTTAEEILLQGQHDGREVTLVARLVQDVPRSASPQLVLQDGSIIFTARVESTTPGALLPAWPSGSLVRLTGVCSIQGSGRNEPHSFRLRLRTAADAQLLARPPWWTARQTLWGLGGLAVVLLVAVAWVVALRRQVSRQTRKLRAEIAEREQMQLQIEKTHRELLNASRLAGMAEIATNVLHNVGNVLNSVNVSSTVVMDNLQKSRISSLDKVVALLGEHESNLADFITNDSRGKQLPDYLIHLAAHLRAEQAEALKELGSLRQNIEHIKAIVAMQQNYARVSGGKEIVNVQELVEDSLRMNLGSLDRHGVKLIREFEDVPPLNVEKHKILQILVNLVRNAKYACDDSGRSDKRLTVRVVNEADRVKISVVDNGVGIPPQNLTRIFGHGFTTRKDGHGFGLHSGALAAKEMGGALHVHSDGVGTGATFTLELPLESSSKQHEKN